MIPLRIELQLARGALARLRAILREWISCRRDIAWAEKERKAHRRASWRKNRISNSHK